ncbi:TetR/AcrR family transcriptional regulator [Actinacidiphila acidipaludis]|uniref:TetR family transcriptional regulator n=1 Tax=Actinacidiphila acidipaludis TaxID=2873382 RepID=A0ABS7QMR9_9ACTN|nr:TetR/AcrR family transcriptional regulator [Streptomyces acidipaludis]MBY8883094.1 TetR family transcriptional regulator [Streptomyces acidipaludis]
MSRVTQAEARANRRRVVEAAARLLRERGVAKVSVADVMHAVGLTQGGFYKQFASKNALVEEAAVQGFTEMLTYLAALDADHGDHAAAWPALLDTYLSDEHRGTPGTGCPAAGFAGDFAREPAWHGVYSDGVREMAGWIAPGETGLTALATLVGSLMLSRATLGTPLSDEILDAARHALEPALGDEAAPD